MSANESVEREMRDDRFMFNPIGVIFHRPDGTSYKLGENMEEIPISQEELHRLRNPF
jgi:hypothetical protein